MEVPVTGSQVNVPVARSSKVSTSKQGSNSGRVKGKFPEVVEPIVGVHEGGGFESFVETFKTTAPGVVVGERISFEKELEELRSKHEKSVPGSVAPELPEGVYVPGFSGGLTLALKSMAKFDCEFVKDGAYPESKCAALEAQVYGIEMAGFGTILDLPETHLNVFKLLFYVHLALHGSNKANDSKFGLLDESGCIRIGGMVITGGLLRSAIGDYSVIKYLRNPRRATRVSGAIQYVATLAQSGLSVFKDIHVQVIARASAMGLGMYPHMIAVGSEHVLGLSVHLRAIITNAHKEYLTSVLAEDASSVAA